MKAELDKLQSECIQLQEANEPGTEAAVSKLQQELYQLQSMYGTLEQAFPADVSKLKAELNMLGRSPAPRGNGIGMLSSAKFATISFLRGLNLSVPSMAMATPSSTNSPSPFARGRTALPGFRHWTASLFGGAFSTLSAQPGTPPQSQATPGAPGAPGADRVFLDESMATATVSDDMRWYGTELGAAMVEDELDTAVWFYGGVGG